MNRHRRNLVWELAFRTVQHEQLITLAQFGELAVSGVGNGWRLSQDQPYGVTYHSMIDSKRGIQTSSQCIKSGAIFLVAIIRASIGIIVVCSL